MSADLWMGIAIGSVAPWVLMIAILRKKHEASAEQLARANAPTELLKERNQIGKEQNAICIETLYETKRMIDLMTPDAGELPQIAIILAERNALKAALEPFLLSYSQAQLDQLADATNGLGEIGPVDAQRQLKARAALGMVERRAE